MCASKFKLNSAVSSLVVVGGFDHIFDLYANRRPIKAGRLLDRQHGMRRKNSNASSLEIPMVDPGK